MPDWLAAVLALAQLQAAERDRQVCAGSKRPGDGHACAVAPSGCSSNICISLLSASAVQAGVLGRWLCLCSRWRCCSCGKNREMLCAAGIFPVVWPCLRWYGCRLWTREPEKSGGGLLSVVLALVKLQGAVCILLLGAQKIHGALSGVVIISACHGGFPQPKSWP